MSRWTRFWRKVLKNNKNDQNKIYDPDCNLKPRRKNIFFCSALEQNFQNLIRPMSRWTKFWRKVLKNNKNDQNEIYYLDCLRKARRKKYVFFSVLEKNSKIYSDQWVDELNSVEKC